MQNNPDTRDFKHSPYYKVNKILLSMIGQWSVQNTKCSLIYQGLISTSLLSVLIVMILKLITSPITMDLVANVVPIIFVILTFITKFCNHIYNKKEMIALLNHMRNDWQEMKLSDEVRIMQKYGENTNRCALIYTLYMYVNLLGYCFISLSSPILDIIAPLNKSRPRKLMIEVEYFVSTEEYFYPISCHICLVAAVGVTILLAIDIIFITYMQHACGLFAIASVHLEYLLYDKRSMIYDDDLSNIDNFFRRRILYCVEIHRKASKFAELIETSFTWSFLIQILMDGFSIGIALVKLLISVDKLDETLQCIILLCAQLLHVFIYSLPGQKLINHSTHIATAAYNGKWYDMPVKSQKLLLLIIRRGMEASYLTTGYVCVISLMSFSKIIQTSMSYFTVLCSL